MSLRTKTRDSEEDPSTSSPAGSNEASSVDEEEQRDGTDRSDEFDADESDDAENEPVSNESTRGDVPHLVSEAVFPCWKKIPIWEECTVNFSEKRLLISNINMTTLSCELCRDRVPEKHSHS